MKTRLCSLPWAPVELQLSIHGSVCWICHLEQQSGQEGGHQNPIISNHQQSPMHILAALETRTVCTCRTVGDFCGLPSWILFSLCCTLEVDSMAVPPVDFLTSSPFISQILFPLFCFWALPIQPPSVDWFLPDFGWQTLAKLAFPVSGRYKTTFLLMLIQN